MRSFFRITAADGRSETLTVGELVHSTVSTEDPLCDTADPNVEELDAPCVTFHFVATRTGVFRADVISSTRGVYMELLTESLGKCCTVPVRLEFYVTGGQTYIITVGLHGALPHTGQAASFELATSIVDPPSR